MNLSAAGDDKRSCRAAWAVSRFTGLTCRPSYDAVRGDFDRAAAVGGALRSREVAMSRTIQAFHPSLEAERRHWPAPSARVQALVIAVALAILLALTLA